MAKLKPSRDFRQEVLEQQANLLVKFNIELPYAQWAANEYLNTVWQWPEKEGLGEKLEKLINDIVQPQFGDFIEKAIKGNLPQDLILDKTIEIDKEIQERKKEALIFLSLFLEVCPLFNFEQLPLGNGGLRLYCPIEKCATNKP